MAWWRFVLSLCNLSTSGSNEVNGSSLNAREIKQFDDAKLQAGDEAVEYFMVVYRQQADRKLLCSNPLFLAIAVYKFLRKENFLNLRRDRQLELGFIERIGKSPPKCARLTDSSSFADPEENSDPAQPCAICPRA